MSSLIELVLTPIDHKKVVVGLDGFYDHLVSHHRFRQYTDMKSLFPDTRDQVVLWSDSLGEVSEDYTDMYQWLTMAGQAMIGEGLHDIEVFLYPLLGQNGYVGLNILIGPTMFEQIFPASGDESDVSASQETRQGVLSFCLGAVAAFENDGFVLRCQQDRLESIEVESIIRRLSQPEMQAMFEDPYFVIGIRKTLLGDAKVSQVWGNENVRETTSGYVVVDILHLQDGDVVETNER